MKEWKKWVNIDKVKALSGESNIMKYIQKHNIMKPIMKYIYIETRLPG